jgi:hypothetical protein
MTHDAAISGQIQGIRLGRRGEQQQRHESASAAHVQSLYAFTLHYIRPTASSLPSIHRPKGLPIRAAQSDER